MGLSSYIRYMRRRLSEGRFFYLNELKGKRVLDMGCGGGNYILDKENWIGIDSSSKCIDACEEKGIKAVLGDITETIYPNEYFDGIIAFQILEHLQPYVAIDFFKEVARLLKPNGVCYITTPMGRNTWGTIDHVRPYFPSAIKKLFEKEFRVHNPNIPKMEVEYVVYQASHPLLTPLANVFPIFREGYLMKIRKVGK